MVDLAQTCVRAAVHTVYTRSTRLSVPPEADREAHVQCPHVVPAPWGDVEGLPWPQGALQPLGLYKQREPGKIRALCIYLV